MKTLHKAGFTIIETMLFLAITAFLIVGLLVGTGTSINIQRYHDSVSSLQSALQQQYSEVANVDNDHGNLSCDGSVKPRGQSDCVILGRFVTTTNSRTLLIKSVIGKIPPNSSTNDVDTLKSYNIEVSPVANETYELEWGSSLVKPGGNNAMVFSMLILRSPLSGIIRTFVDSSSDIPVADGDIETLLTPSALSQSTKLCINSNGLFTGRKSAVVVMVNATSSSGIETLGDNSGC